jgi:parallel beta-helix repeat protein
LHSALGLASVVLFVTFGCGSASKALALRPTQAPSSDGVCLASMYPGGTGGERIQNAVDDAACRTVSIDQQGPDAGAWSVSRPIVLRSDLVLEGSGSAQPVLTAIDSAGGAGLLVIDRGSMISIRHVTLRSNKRAPNGIWIRGSRDITITQSIVSGATFNGIAITETPSSGITISETTVEDSGKVAVRTDTHDLSAYHSRVLVTNNVISNAPYGAALANCGNSAAGACEIRDNQIVRISLSAIDLNRSHAAIVSGNQVSGGKNCITVDDTQESLISGNTVSGCSGYGIVLANGAEAGNRPWSVSGNKVTNNTVLSNGRYGLAAYGSETDPSDRCESNTFANNRIEGNAAGGCNTSVRSNTFTGNGPQECRPQH